MREKRIVQIIIFLILGVFLGIISVQCNRGANNREAKKENWMARVQFADSTYVKAKDNYLIGDTIYVLATELAQAMPESTEIILRSKIGDKETLLNGWPPEVDVTAMLSAHGGKIKCEGKTTPTVENSALEVNSQGDTITAYYNVKGDIALDTAYVKPVSTKGGVK